MEDLNIYNAGYEEGYYYGWEDGINGNEFNLAGYDLSKEDSEYKAGFEYGYQKGYEDGQVELENNQ